MNNTSAANKKIIRFIFFKCIYSLLIFFILFHNKKPREIVCVGGGLARAKIVKVVLIKFLM